MKLGLTLAVLALLIWWLKLASDREDEEPEYPEMWPGEMPR